MRRISIIQLINKPLSRLSGDIDGFLNRLGTTRSVVVLSLTGLFGLLSFYLAVFTDATLVGEPEFHTPQVVVSDREEYKFMRPDLGYREIYPEPRFSNLNMIGSVELLGVSGKNTEERLMGMLLRTLRFQNITSKVEKRYGLPDKLLMAMIMQESGGADLLPNARDDGGLGLSHMQPYMARAFGLRTYENCDKMVDKEHGRKLRKLIEDSGQNRKKLIGYDDRFHPILNIDAAGRMLAYYMNGPQTANTRLKTAIYGYAGRYNYPAYYKSIMHYLSKLNDKRLMRKLEAEFNRINPQLKINGKAADFDDYMEVHQRQNRNYGLDAY